MAFMFERLDVYQKAVDIADQPTIPKKRRIMTSPALFSCKVRQFQTLAVDHATHSING